MPSALRSKSRHVTTRAPCTCAGASGSCSAMTSKASANVQPGMGGEPSAALPAVLASTRRALHAWSTPECRAVDFELPAEDDPRRAEVRAWLTEHPNPTGRVLAEAGYVAPHWPKPYGLDADPITQMIIDD